MSCVTRVNRRYGVSCGLSELLFRPLRTCWSARSQWCSRATATRGRAGRP